MCRGVELAVAEVRDTTAVLLWPARMTWVGPETITTLIETHGLDHATVLRPAWQGEPGWPVLLPTAHLAALRAIAPDRMPPDVIADLVATLPSRDRRGRRPGRDPRRRHAIARPCPPYEGPPDPPGGRSHEWGADVAAEAGLTEP